MAYYLFSIISFLCLLISDYLQIIQKRIPIILFSIAGYGGITASLIFSSISYWNTEGYSVITGLKALFLVFSFALLLYQLFLEIPLSPQIQKTQERMAVQQGSYSHVRHPAFYPFLLLTAALSLLVNNRHFIPIALLMNVLNFILIVIEDIFIFPEVFDNYSDYKKNVPFLVPDLKRYPRQD